jgi:hypothetical protein
MHFDRLQAGGMMLIFAHDIYLSMGVVQRWRVYRLREFVVFSLMPSHIRCFSGYCQSDYILSYMLPVHD